MRRTNKDAPRPTARTQAKRSRVYHLSAAGLGSLRAAAAANKPWSRSTGPRTQTGKARAAQNALRHGLRAAGNVALQRAMREGLRMAAGDVRG
ncbi:MAG: hypothetical protein DYG92_08455 [Leptolyngbya sp. PLA1]|nr:hypothetical protein [Leptolyngbya sp. PLA1]